MQGTSQGASLDPLQLRRQARTLARSSATLRTQLLLLAYRHTALQAEHARCKLTDESTVLRAESADAMADDEARMAALVERLERGLLSLSSDNTQLKVWYIHLWHDFVYSTSVLTKCVCVGGWVLTLHGSKGVHTHMHTHTHTGASARPEIHAARAHNPACPRCPARVGHAGGHGTAAGAPGCTGSRMRNHADAAARHACIQGTFGDEAGAAGGCTVGDMHP